MSKEKVVLAYSGGLDTSIILKWLIEEGYEVVAYIADVGQEEDFKAAEAKALKIGAAKVYIEDLKEEFVRDYIYPTFKSQAVYEGRYLLGTAVARPIIAKRHIEIAAKEKAAYVSHGATGKGNDQVRFELGYYALNPDITVLAPWKMESFLTRFKGRTDMLNYADQHGIEVTATRKKPYSEDDNLLHISHEAGVLEDPAAACEEDVYSRTSTPADWPDEADLIALTFKDGIPVKVEHDGKAVTGDLEIFEFLNEMGRVTGSGGWIWWKTALSGLSRGGFMKHPAELSCIMRTAIWKV